MLIKSAIGEAIFLFSALLYVIFWVWAIVHALQTPRATAMQRALWVVALVVNPMTAIWYWYIWKRWAFWALFTPLMLAFATLPFAVRAVLSKANATAITNALFALGSTRLVILVAALFAFPLVLRLVALFHLGKNTELTAMDRNDWIVSLALPVFGFGASIAYCARERRVWALIGLLWILVMGISLKTVTINISNALIPAGDERRQEFIQNINLLRPR